MKNILRNANHQLRGGWKIACYFLILIALVALMFTLRRMLPESPRHQVPEPLLLALGALFASAICLHAEGQEFTSIGLRLDPKFGREFVAGAAIGVGLLAVTAVAIWLCGGVDLVPAGRDALSLVWKITRTLLPLAIFEEVAFRGYPFQRAIQSMGLVRAQLLFAVIFALMHLPNEGVNPSTILLAMTNIFFASLMLGSCYWRTGSLALPIGLHFAWNWTQTCLGFPASGNPSVGLWQPVYHGKPAWLTGADFGPEASVISVALLIVMVVLLARRRDRCTSNSAVLGKH